MFGKALRLLRRSHDLKQRELATKLDISRSYVSELESGNRTPSLDLLDRYAQTFKIPVSSLVFFAEALEEKSEIGTKLNNAKGAIARKIINMLQFLDEKDDENEKETSR